MSFELTNFICSKQQANFWLLNTHVLSIYLIPGTVGKSEMISYFWRVYKVFLIMTDLCHQYWWPKKDGIV